VVNLELLGLQSLKQLNRNRFDSFDIRWAQIPFLQQIKDRQRLFVKTFTHSPAFFFVEVIDKTKQGLECLLNGYPIFLTIVFGHDLLIMPLEVRT